MRFTTPIPVSGYVQRSTIFDSPLFVRCSIITHTFFAPTARSIAPPTAGIASPPVDQLARAPETDTWNAPRSEEHTSELQSPCNLVCRLLLEKKKKKTERHYTLNKSSNVMSPR